MKTLAQCTGRDIEARYDDEGKQCASLLADALNWYTKKTFTIGKTGGLWFVIAPEGYAILWHGYMGPEASKAWRSSPGGTPHVDNRLEFRVELVRRDRDNHTQLETIRTYYGEPELPTKVTMLIDKSLTDIAGDVMKRLVKPNIDMLTQRQQQIEQAMAAEAYTDTMFHALVDGCLPGIIVNTKERHAYCYLGDVIHRYARIEITTGSATPTADGSYELSVGIKLDYLPRGLAGDVIQLIRRFMESHSVEDKKQEA